MAAPRGWVAWPADRREPRQPAALVRPAPRTARRRRSTNRAGMGGSASAKVSAAKDPRARPREAPSSAASATGRLARADPRPQTGQQRGDPTASAAARAASARPPPTDRRGPPLLGAGVPHHLEDAEQANPPTRSDEGRLPVPPIPAACPGGGGPARKVTAPERRRGEPHYVDDTWAGKVVRVALPQGVGRAVSATMPRTAQRSRSRQHQPDHPEVPSNSSLEHPPPDPPARRLAQEELLEGRGVADQQTEVRSSTR